MLAGGSFLYYSHFMSRLRTVHHHLTRLHASTPLMAVLIFACASFFFALTTAPASFIDPDAFYHMTMSQLMLDQRGVITEFPWLQFTTLKEAYVDHHLLYHILLIPFIAACGQPIGLKIATVVLGAGVITTIFLVLRSLAVRHAWVWSLVLLFSYDFVFRLSLGKANSLSLIILFAGFFAVVRKQRRLLAVLAFCYVWAYGGFVQLLVLACVASAVRIGALLVRKQTSLKHILRECAEPSYVLAGMIAGLVIHPSFPLNFSFLWEQVVQIALINYQDTIPVGLEWYPTSVTELLIGAMPLTVACLIALLLSITHRKQLSVQSLIAGGMAVLCVVLTFKSRRYIEYAVPWAVLWAALTAHDARWFARLRSWLTNRWSGGSEQFTRWIVTGVMIYAVAGFAVMGVSAGVQLFEDYRNGRPFSHMSEIGEWLTDNAQPGSLIFHDDWDVFPHLFHHAPGMYYIVGLDPTFMYRYDAQLHTEWVAITTGKQTENLHEAIARRFSADYVVMDHDHTAMRHNIEHSSGFTLVHEDTDGVIFAVEK